MAYGILQEGELQVRAVASSRYPQFCCLAMNCNYYAGSDRSWQSESICELKTKIPQNKLYSTEHIELLSTVGQGIHDIYSIQKH